ncbi:MAG: hypothetical protein GX568_07420 [Candidatus Gastranaerophilales bacterium]|jgi:ABC-type multidrug transport system fused ATPase/permease subunit|nr:hypothetical protein [Candidatus Gastranaerophilales bacterium]
MNKDCLKEKINSLRDIRNHNWQALILTIGGTLALLFNMDTALRKLFFALGIVVIFILINAYFEKENRIRKYIKEMEKEK